MQDITKGKVPLREYARREKICLQAAYQRIWNQRVEAEMILGRWFVSVDKPEQQATDELVNA